ncbi:hypothetical protein [Phytohalomonas tamaricis]|uniref:hypothetical protein n=1 Tax=Phytohalomonas tamaricis TaxID=2081032 RepID=UPI00131A1ACC|nr:hypothetical protein [Phytohalomonas tamaricis]
MLELSGNGRIAVDATSAENAPFTIIDASELSGGLSYSASTDVQEVINLADVSNGEPIPQPPLYGSIKLEPIGHDVLDFSGEASTYGLDGDGIDTVYGFDTDDDSLIVNGEAITAQYSLDLGTILNGAETLEEAFKAASEANNGDNYLPFVFGESDDFDLYLYKDLGTDGLDSDDFALHLTNLKGEAGLLGMKDNRDFIPSGDNGFNNPNQFSSFNIVDVDSDIVNGTEYAPDNFVFDTEDLVFDSRNPDAAPSVTIANFEPNYDTLDFSALSEVQSAYPFGDPVRTVVGVTNDDGEYATVFLAGIHKFSLNLEDNFIFAS